MFRVCHAALPPFRAIAFPVSQADILSRRNLAKYTLRYTTLRLPIAAITTATMWMTRLISLTNFCVASSALGFQVFVLYPWHEQLSEDFEGLKKEHLRVLDAVAKMEVEVRKERGTSLLERVGWTKKK